MIKIFNHYFNRSIVLQMFFDLCLLILIITGTALYLRLEYSTLPSVVMQLFVPTFVGMFLINKSLGIYQRGHKRALVQTCARAVFAMIIAQPLILAVTANSEEKSAFYWALVASFAIVLLIRIYVAHSKPWGMMRQRILVFGTGKRARAVGETLKRSDPNLELVGYYANPSETIAEVSLWGLLSPEKNLMEIVLTEQVDEIIVALSDRRGGSLPLEELLDCKVQGIKVIDIATHFEKTLGQIRLESVSPGWLIFGDGFEQGFARTAVKRIFDITCASILILLTWPIMLITGILILIESGMPILYLQQRVGLNGSTFNVVKFRSMRTDAEKDGKPRWATAGDDRITRLGRIIRKLRIDELPQLFSVLSGSMSLVGPRPERPYFVSQLSKEIPYFNVRQTVKPGVTGWAQVRYQYGASVEDAIEKLQYDLYYVKNHSLFLDLIVLFETIGVVLMRKGSQ
jgi:sugar transferase (PEP-CTERM system associated)